MIQKSIFIAFILLIFWLYGCTDITKISDSREQLDSNIRSFYLRPPFYEGDYGEHIYNGFYYIYIREGAYKDKTTPYYKLLFANKKSDKFYITYFAYMCNYQVINDRKHGNFIGVRVCTLLKNDICELYDSLKEVFGHDTPESEYLYCKKLDYVEMHEPYLLFKKTAVACLMNNEESLYWLNNNKKRTIVIPHNSKVYPTF